MAKKVFISLTLLFVFSGRILAQIAVNADKFVHDTNVFERGYWEAKSGNDTYVIQFKKVTKDVREEFDLKDIPPHLNPILTLLLASYKHLINDKIIEEKNINGLRGAPLSATEYLEENKLIMDYSNSFLKEKGKVVFQIDFKNPDRMIWLYTKSTQDLIILHLNGYNQGEQRTPTHLIFYRKTK